MRSAVVLLLLLASVHVSATAQAGASGLSVTLRSDTVRVGDEVQIEIRNRTPHPVLAGLCGSTLQKRTPDRAWMDVDTLDCDPPNGPNALAPESGRMILRLQSGLGPGLDPASGPGTYRLLVAASDSAGRPLAPGARASQPFVLLDFATVCPAAMARYGQLEGWKALAAARRPGRGYVWGYGHGYDTGSQAANRALRECRQRAAESGAGECWVVRVDAGG